MFNDEVALELQAHKKCIANAGCDTRFPQEGSEDGGCATGEYRDRWVQLRYLK